MTAKVAARQYPNSGAAWTDLERLNLYERFDHGDTLEQLVVAHGRTANSIVSALTVGRRLLLSGRTYYRVSPEPFTTFEDIRTFKDKT